MFIDLSHPVSTTFATRLGLFTSVLVHAFKPKASAHVPAELGRLSDHLLRDIGVDPRGVRSPTRESALSLELLRREWP